MATTPSYQMHTHDVLSPTLTEEDVGRSRFCGVRDFFDRVDEYITTSRFGKVFHLAGSGHVGIHVTESQPPLLTINQAKEIAGSSFFREIRAGLTTFATMAYIIAVNVNSHSPLVFLPVD